MKRLLAAAALLFPIAIVVGCSNREKVDPYADEVREREAFAKRLLSEADAGRAFGVSSRSDVQFEEGFGILSYEGDKEDGHPSFTNHAFRWMGQNAHVRLKSHGARPMKLVLVGWVHKKVVGTEPTIHLYLDGVYVGSSKKIDPGGHYWLETIVPEWAIRREWLDLVVRTTAVGYHWGDPPELKVLNVYRFEWTEAN